MNAPKVLTYETPQICYDDLSHALVNLPHWNEGIRGTWNRRMWTTDVIVRILEPTSVLNLAVNDFGISRWTKRFLPEYVERESFVKFLELLENRRSNNAQEYGFQTITKARHSLGTCLLGVTVRTGKNPRVNLYSRSCYLQPTGMLDLSFGALLSQFVQKVTGGSKIELHWHIAHLQTNCWKILPYLLNSGYDLETYINESICNDKQKIYRQYMLDAYERITTDRDPNPRYQFYSRMTKKVKRILKRQADGIELPMIVPYLPNNYLPERHWIEEDSSFEDLEDDEDEQDDEDL